MFSGQWGNRDIIIITRHSLFFSPLRWFEANVPGSVPNEFSVPFFGLAKKCWRRCKTAEKTNTEVEVEENR